MPRGQLPDATATVSDVVGVTVAVVGGVTVAVVGGVTVAVVGGVTVAVVGGVTVAVVGGVTIAVVGGVTVAVVGGVTVAAVGGVMVAVVGGVTVAVSGGVMVVVGVTVVVVGVTVLGSVVVAVVVGEARNRSRTVLHVINMASTNSPDKMAACHGWIIGRFLVTRTATGGRSAGLDASLGTNTGWLARVSFSESSSSCNGGGTPVMVGKLLRLPAAVPSAVAVALASAARTSESNKSGRGCAFSDVICSWMPKPEGDIVAASS
jgi:hypothetical protein